MIDSKILKQYSNGDKYFDYNLEDKDLATIRVEFPETPEWSTILGYGLPAKDQFFKIEKIPEKIIELQTRQDKEKNFLVQNEIWDIINDNQEYYKNEIAWIKLQWERRLFGLWFFNNGKATYIDGWHYCYLNFWELDDGLPEYRDRDRLFFNFARFCYNDPKSYGFIYVKFRREGLTSKASCINYFLITLVERGHSGIQSMTDKHAETVFQKHVVDPWKGRRMCFFFKPNTDGGDDPKTVLSFRPVSSKGTVGNKKKSIKGLLSSITYQASNPKAYDTWKLYYYFQDECGKSEQVNINNRWRIAKLCLSTGAGSNIQGYSIHGSTVGELSKGGENFRTFCEQSDYNKRNKNGQTATGLYVLFIPSYHGLQGYIDRYGMSVVDTPTEEQKTYLKTRIGSEMSCPNTEIGAKEYLENQVEYLKNLGDYDELSGFIRQHPLTYRSAFIGELGDSFFNLTKVNDQIDELREWKEATTTGYFDWQGEKFKSRVVFIPDIEPRKAKFKLSLVLADSESNKVFYDPSLRTWVALNPKFCAGADPFKARRTKAKKNSSGGGAVYWGHQASIDDMNKPIDKWESARTICTYLHRPDEKNEYSEDMIMMCLYYGSPIYIETNVQDLADDFIEWGYEGMLVHKYNVETKKTEDIAGQATSPKTHQEIFKLIQHHVKYHCHRERHIDFLEQVRDINSTDEMTKFDLFSAVGYAMLGFSQYGKDLNKVDSQTVATTTQEYLEEYTYQ